MQPKPTIIPIEICQTTLKNKEIRVLQVFIWLKIKCSGKIFITPEILKEIKCDLNIKSEKTVKKHIQQLLDTQWITISKRSGYYFIKGFESIRKLEGFSKRTGAEFHFKDIKNFKGFLVAAIISQLIAMQKKWQWVTERKKRGSLTVTHQPQLFYPVANTALAAIFNISISTAYEWKKMAKKHGFLRIRKNFSRLGFLDAWNINEFRKYGDIPVGKICFRKGQYYERFPDMVDSKIVLKSRKKLVEK